jgi:biopolymer transport protein ExbD
MAEKRRFLDVWLVESNTIYQEVPFTVVTDWVQQSRLLEEDMVRPSGTNQWFKIGVSPDFKPYLPRVEPHRAEDQAEALEPVEIDMHWKRSHEEDDDDVDMIPLIDVSLVLLIFFMLTASGVGAAMIPTPEADYAELADRSEVVWIGINLEGDGDNRTPVFSLGEGDKAAAGEDRDLHSLQEVEQRLLEFLANKRGKVEISIDAHPDVESGLVRDLTLMLQKPVFARKIEKKYIGVKERDV